MKKVTLLLSALVLLFCTSFQDEKKSKELPPATHTGENVFACKVNGELMVAKENSSDIIGNFGIKLCDRLVTNNLAASHLAQGCDAIAAFSKGTM